MHDHQETSKNDATTQLHRCDGVNRFCFKAKWSSLDFAIFWMWLAIVKRCTISSLELTWRWWSWGDHCPGQAFVRTCQLSGLACLEWPTCNGLQGFNLLIQFDTCQSKGLQFAETKATVWLRRLGLGVCIDSARSASPWKGSEICSKMPMLEPITRLDRSALSLLFFAGRSKSAVSALKILSREVLQTCGWLKRNAVSRCSVWNSHWIWN